MVSITTTIFEIVLEGVVGYETLTGRIFREIGSQIAPVHSYGKIIVKLSFFFHYKERSHPQLMTGA